MCVGCFRREAFRRGGILNVKEKITQRRVGNGRQRTVDVKTDKSTRYVTHGSAAAMAC